MAAISIRNLDQQVKERLRVRAAEHGRSMESEVRDILTRAVGQTETDEGLFTALVRRFGEAGGTELELPRRSTRARGASFER